MSIIARYMAGERRMREATPEEVAKETSLPFTRENIQKISEHFPTPFYIYDWPSIKQNAEDFMGAFSWAPKFRNFFAVKANPNPHIVSKLHELGLGADCSSDFELQMVQKIGMKGEEVMFTSNNTPANEFVRAHEIGAIINLDDISLIPYLRKAIGQLPRTLCFRYNPGELKSGGNEIIGRPQESKYGLRTDQLSPAYEMAKEEGVEDFWMHTMVGSNERNVGFFGDTGRLMFGTAVELHKRGIRIKAINLGGGVGVPYQLDHPKVDPRELSEEIREQYEAIIIPAGLHPIQITMECGRYITGPYGYFVMKVRHLLEKYRDYIGVDGSITSLLRIAMYDAYHHITILGKEGAPREYVYDITGSLCENNDKFATQREFPKIDLEDFVVVHEGGAHAIAMANEYNGKPIPGELMLMEDGVVKVIRRPRDEFDYFSTVVNFEGFGDENVKERSPKDYPDIDLRAA